MEGQLILKLQYCLKTGEEAIFCKQKWSHSCSTYNHLHPAPFNKFKSNQTKTEEDILVASSFFKVRTRRPKLFLTCNEGTYPYTYENYKGYFLSFRFYKIRLMKQSFVKHELYNVVIRNMTILIQQSEASGKDIVCAGSPAIFPHTARTIISPKGGPFHLHRLGAEGKHCWVRHTYIFVIKYQTTFPNHCINVPGLS